jgi:hypothetical protein
MGQIISQHAPILRAAKNPSIRHRRSTIANQRACGCIIFCGAPFHGASLRIDRDCIKGGGCGFYQAVHLRIMAQIFSTIVAPCGDALRLGLPYGHHHYRNIPMDEIQPAALLMPLDKPAHGSQMSLTPLRVAQGDVAINSRDLMPR